MTSAPLRLRRLVVAQEDLFQAGFARLKVGRPMLRGDLDDLVEVALHRQMDGMLVAVEFHDARVRYPAEPADLRFGGEGDLHHVMFQIAQAADGVDGDEPPFADDADTVAGMLNFR